MKWNLDNKESSQNWSTYSLCHFTKFPVSTKQTTISETSSHLYNFISFFVCWKSLRISGSNIIYEWRTHVVFNKKTPCLVPPQALFWEDPDHIHFRPSMYRYNTESSPISEKRFSTIRETWPPMPWAWLSTNHTLTANIAPFGYLLNFNTKGMTDEWSTLEKILFKTYLAHVQN